MRTIPRVPRLLLLSLVTLGCQEAASPTDPAPPGAVIASDSAVAAAREDCVRITAPGTYTLTRDIIGCPHWSAVQITADDVTLRLNGHRISGFGYEYQMPAIAAGGRNIRILGPGLVEGYLAGATISGVEHFEMREVTFVHTPDYGLWIYGGRDVRIVDNTFTGMNYIAIAGGADSLLIAGNRFDGTAQNGENGLRVSGNALVIRDNHIHDFGFGILVSGQGAVIAHNDLAGVGTGILVYAGATGNLITRNRLDTVIGAAQDDNPCGTNQWVGNRFAYAFPPCLQ